jgi:hypothetical protein
MVPRLPLTSRTKPLEAMASNPISDPIRHLSAMMGQLGRQHQALAGHIDRLVTGLGDLSKDMRVGFRATEARMDALRTEMNERFRAVGSRFDDVDERLTRFEDGMRAMHSDLLRLENNVLNAQQSALEAHLRLDQGSPGGGQEPSR